MIACLLTLVVAAAPAWDLPAIDAPGVEHRTLQSRAAGARVSYDVFLPPEYNARTADRFPVLYWLHGSGGGRPGVEPLSRFFGAAMRSGKAPSMIIVFANGLPGGMWIDSKDGERPVESVVMKELIPDVDAHYRTIARREGRVVEGFSMGGYGAGRLGFKYTDVFCGVSMLAGGPLQAKYADKPEGKENLGRDKVYEVAFGNDDAFYTSQHPRSLVKGANLGRTLLRVAVGDVDSLAAPNEDFHQYLEKLGVAHEFFVAPGVDHNSIELMQAMGERHGSFYKQAFGPAIEGLKIEGDRWSCRADGVETSGLLQLPEGEGPFPAVILSHGLGGAAQSMVRNRGSEWLERGYAVIATDYTHAGGQDRIDFAQAGASKENIRRARACLNVLSLSPKVDTTRVVAYGHSMGAFLTVALAADAPHRLRGAVITAGGLAMGVGRLFPAPTAEVAANVRAPFLILHGTADTVVRPEASKALAEALAKAGTVVERHTFEGVGHNLPGERADEMNKFIDAFLSNIRA